MTSFTLERLSNITTVRLNGREAAEKEEYARQNERIYKECQTAYNAQGTYMSFINVATNVSLIAVLYVGGSLISQGKMTAGSLTRFAIQSGFVGLGFAGLSTFYSDLTKSLDAANRVFQVIDKNRGTSKAKRRAESPSRKAGDRDGAIDIKGVNFAYATRQDQPVLVNFSLSISGRGIYSIVGKSGAGKSTLLCLLCGLYSPDSGSITMDGVNTEGVDSKWFSDRVGVVEQRPGLLSGTILSNIAYGKEGAGREQVIQAAKDAYAHDFIMSFPNGYDTEIGTGGNLLSGGQAARIAIARALVRNPTFLLLDEATAALDEGTEGEIVSLLLDLSASKTIVAFTHSEMLMRSSKVVSIVSNGSVLASGSFHSLEERYKAEI
jgi:ABC-type multidrug transport system fused ATPase/permease subunit